MGDTLNRRYEAGLAGFMRANQGKNLIPLIVDAADAAVDIEAAGMEMSALVDEGLIKSAAPDGYLQWEWSQRIVNAALGRQG